MALVDVSGSAYSVGTLAGLTAMVMSYGVTFHGSAPLQGIPGLYTPLDGALLGSTLLDGGIQDRIPVSGTASGTSTTSAQVGYILWVSGEALGDGPAEGTLTRRFITSGFPHGLGTLHLAHEDSQGHAFGLGVLSGTPVRPVALEGAVRGQGRLSWSYPLPLRGHTTLAAYMEVFQVPVPICLRAPVRSYRWGQDFQRGDLGIWLRQIGGFAISPFKVTYALYQVVPGNQQRLVGPPERVPATGDVGEFYATGIAGMGGQPGRWVIKWRYQVSFGGPTYEEAMEFDVLDTVLAGVSDPNRVCKKGWF